MRRLLKRRRDGVGPFGVWGMPWITLDHSSPPPGESQSLTSNDPGALTDGCECGPRFSTLTAKVES